MPLQICALLKEIRLEFPGAFSSQRSSYYDLKLQIHICICRLKSYQKLSGYKFTALAIAIQWSFGIITLSYIAYDELEMIIPYCSLFTFKNGARQAVDIYLNAMLDCFSIICLHILLSWNRNKQKQTAIVANTCLAQKYQARGYGDR